MINIKDDEINFYRYLRKKEYRNLKIISEDELIKRYTALISSLKRANSNYSHEMKIIKLLAHLKKKESNEVIKILKYISISQLTKDPDLIEVLFKWTQIFYESFEPEFAIPFFNVLENVT